MRSSIFGRFGALAFASAIAAPAMAAPTVAGVAPSFVAAFSSQPADALASIARGCAQEGQVVVERDAEAVTCEIPLGRPERIAARVLLRALFQPAPHAFIRFQATPSSVAGSMVKVTGWVEDAPAGYVRRTASLAGSRFDQRLKTFLAKLGGRTAQT